MLSRKVRFSAHLSLLFGALLLSVFAGAMPGGEIRADGNIEDEPSASSLAPELPFERISLEQGLSQVSVNQILQDQMGFIWLATQDGLNRYDGYTFTVYRPDPANPDSIGHRYITALAEDKKSGDLWIGTPAGLDHFNRATGKFFHYRNIPGRPDSLSGNAISAVYVDSAGAIWVGTAGSGLNRLDPVTGAWTRFVQSAGEPSSLSDNAVTSILEDHVGGLWVGTQTGGLNLYHPTSGGFERFVFRENTSNSLSGNHVTAIYEDQRGTLWVGTGGAGLNQFDRQKKSFYRHRVSPQPFSISHNMITSIVEDQQGALWVGTYGGGINLFDRTTGRFFSFRNLPDNTSSLSDNFVLSLYLDQGGILWVGTLGSGLNKLNRAPRLFTHISRSSISPSGQSLSSNLVWAIQEDRTRNLWVGTQVGLDRYELSSGRWSYYRHDPANPNTLGSGAVLALELDGTAAVWIGTSGAGLNHFDRLDDQFTRYTHDPDIPQSLANNTVTSLMMDRRGKLWVGTGNGLDLFDQGQRGFIHIRPRSGDLWLGEGDCIYAIFEDVNGTLWLGTDGSGLISYSPGSGRSRQYLPSADDKGAGSIHSQVVFSVYQDRQGIFWLGTNNGLERFDPGNETFILYGARDGLPSEVVYGILEDERGYLWLSTNDGLVKFESGVGVISVYGVDDGLQSREFNSGAYFRNAFGEMYFGGVNGFNIFDPESLSQVRPSIPPVVLTGLTQHGAPLLHSQPVETIQDITLRWPDNAFEFEFAALTFAHPAKNEYAYFLEGFDKDWNYISNKRYGRYTNLPGGRYTLRLKASDNNGVWNEAGVSIRVEVIPPIWQRRWFQGLIILVLALIALGVYRMRVKSVESRSRQLEKMVEERTFSLEERTRELETLYQADEDLYRNLQLDQVLQSLLDAAVNILDADKGALMVWNEAHDRLVARATHGFDPSNVSKLSFAPGQGVTGSVALCGEPIIVLDVDADARVTREIVESEHIQSFIQVPIKVGGEVFGVFSVDYIHPHPIAAQEKRLLISLAQRAALAIQNAQIYEKTQERAIAEERSRLARDLHDAVTQTLFSASLIAEALPVAWDNDPQEGRTLLQELRSLSRGALAEMRTLLLELRPSVLVDANMSDLLRQLAEAASGREGIPVTVKMKGSCCLSQDVHIAVYRIAQEAINNVVRHARAAHVSISLDCEPGENGATRCLTLKVEDDGCGFDPHIIQRNHLGLQNMSERAQAIGARLTIQSSPGLGTAVTVQWASDTPCPEETKFGDINVYKIR